ncbi:ImmA/IrrE family metallo-endopeptidase [Halonatronum saccharophilum]|uniref:ImmA/IrrE family metallo-endopeptidase n=1 Tax=Halonatronum saccharophilum TaxID=150060 RepID=UPI000489DE19|nr:ImmA/IrrE family metallo-endopeptidase [Halonatronum saccharophilum]
MKKNIIELKARQYLKLHNLSYPTDLNYILKKRNIKLVNRKLTKDEAMFVRTGEEKIIIIDKRQSIGQLRFNTAHELGHDILGVGNSIFDNHPPPLAKRSLTDRQADIFASELLIPTPSLKKEALKYNYNLEILASIFKVTLQAMKTKMIIKGLPYESLYERQNFFIV